MINQDNFKVVLTSLGFQETKNVFSKHFEDGNFYLKADFNKHKLEYPEKLKILGEFTTSFDKNENFVVFECIHRLLNKGYKPEHLELEKKWDLGGGAKGGRADILVLDQLNQPLLIVECKTAGREFEKEWKETLLDGGQLFTYLQQDNETQFLCLYAADFDDTTKEVIPQQYIVSVKDNEQTLLTDSKLKSFKEANNVKERYRVWKNTYQLEFDTRGIFEKNIPPYAIGKAHYTLNDLQIVAENDIQKKYHEFATILRQHNVSGRENAFDKLVNLFLAKIVDEKHNPQNLQFRWRGIAADNYFSFIDRLEKLYTNGMKEFLKEDVTFVEQSMVIEAFKYVKNDPDATRETVLKHFRRQKYFTNNDFSFIDVHNEKLFYQNVVILRQMVQMIENVQLNGDQQNQFLGDLFEGFLDRGVKQSEGQFFTPMPVVKFILMSLPLKHLVENSSEIPKAIDYACGAGHFLTELAAQLKTVVEETKTDIPAKEFYSNLYGIEKEYRLSKVAKVSAFMYSQDEINIYYADALTSHAAIKNESFDLLVANPPFAVKGFLETLSEEERNAFSLTEQISDLSKNNNIQCFFLERAKQLLKVGGMTGIIVPSSVLSNSDTTHIATREMLLQYFDIVALSEFGNRTFGKTGTSTIVLFLRKKDDNPLPHAHYKERVDSWFSDNDELKQIVYVDQHFIEQYCQHIEIAFEDYTKLLHATDDMAAILPLMQYEMFKDYKAAFKKTEDKIRETQRKEYLGKEKEWTNKHKREHANATEKELKDFVNADLTILKQAHTKALHKALIEYLQNIEKDKLYYFVLAKTNPQKILIVKSPAENVAQKKFLGYDWSGSKGSEGIKYLASAAVVNDEDDDDRVLQNLNAKRAINTPLFDNNKAENPTKINYYIQQNFLKAPLSIPDDLQPFLTYARLEDLLDFSRKDFNKAFSLTPKKNMVITTQWDLVKLENIMTIARGASPRPISDYISTSENSVNWIKIGDVKEGEKYITKTEEKITQAGAKLSRPVKEGDFILSNSMSFGRPYILKISGCVHDGWLILTDFDRRLNKDFLYEILSYEDTQKQFSESAVGGVVQNLNTERVRATKIPLPPLSIQQQIVAECEAIDKAVNEEMTAIETSKKEIEQRVSNFKGELSKLIDITTKIGSGATPLGGENAYKESGISLIRSQNIYDEGFTDKGLAFIDDEQAAKLNNVIVEATDVLFNITGASVARCCVVDTKYLPARVNQHVAIIRPNEKIISKYLQLTLTSPTAKSQLLAVAGNSSTREAITKSQLENFKIPVPPLSIQEELVAEIETLENKIAASQVIINAAAGEKQAVMRKYL